MRFFYLLMIVFFTSSCGINSYIMLRDTNKDEYEIPPIKENPEYRISPNDVISFRLLTDDGFPLIDPKSQQSTNQNLGLNTVVEYNGLVKLPYLGRVKIEGLSLREAEIFLEEKYSELFRKPYVIISVTNRRVIVSTGGGGTARVVTLNNNNTTVMEVLALAGGIDLRGNAKKIKVIRKTADEREIYRIDLSTIDGVDLADMVVQANDIIYVEPRKNYATELVREIAPYLTLLSSTLLIINFINITNR